MSTKKQFEPDYSNGRHMKIAYGHGKEENDDSPQCSCNAYDEKFTIEQQSCHAADCKFFQYAAAEKIKSAMKRTDFPVAIDADILGGQPVIAETRFPLYQIFAELAAGNSIDEIADEFGLDVKKLERIMQAFAAGSVIE